MFFEVSFEVFFSKFFVSFSISNYKEYMMVEHGTRIEFIIVDDQISADILPQLLDIYDDKAATSNYGNTTNVVVLYMNDLVVGGALVRITTNLVIMKRMCISDQHHSVIILQYLSEMFHEMEMHINVHVSSIPHYRSLGFEIRYRKNCNCAKRPSFSHLTLRGPMRAPAPVPMGAPALVPMRAPAPVPMGAPAPVPMEAPAPVPIGAPAPVPVPVPVPVPIGAPAPVPIPVAVAIVIGIKKVFYRS